MNKQQTTLIIGRCGYGKTYTLLHDNIARELKCKFEGSKVRFVTLSHLDSRLENISRSSTQSNNSLGNSIPVRITNLPYQAYNHYLKGVNYKNLSYIRCTNNQQSGFVPIDFCLLNTRSINNK